MSGNQEQGSQAVALGYAAGAAYQSASAVAIGTTAGNQDQGSQAVAIGGLAGSNLQGSQAVAIGYQAGQANQGYGAVAVGTLAGYNIQGNYAIAIGYNAGNESQAGNSIILNAGAYPLDSGTSGLFINPVRQLAPTPNLLYYDTYTNEVSYGAKTFVIDHPDEPTDRYLVHTCLEGPEVGVYYRGTSYIPDTGAEFTEVHLPKYVKKLVKDPSSATAVVTPIFNGTCVRTLNVGKYDTERNSFVVYGAEGEFNWTFTASRDNCVVEPLKKDVVKHGGNGPYTWLSAATTGEYI